MREGGSLERREGGEAGKGEREEGREMGLRDRGRGEGERKERESEGGYHVSIQSLQIHQEMERLHLHHSTQAPPRTKATPTQALKTTPTPDGDKGGARPGERAATPTQEGQ